MALPTPTTNFVFLSYSFDIGDIQALQADLLTQMRRTWVRALIDESRRFGCANPSVKQPSGRDADALERMAQADAESIAATFNKELTAQILKVYRENPRANRQLYAQRLDAWLVARSRYKPQQIALNTETKAREYARRRFWDENRVKVTFRMLPLTATCKECTRIIARGNVSREFVDRFPAPRHINCVHEYVPNRPKQISCADQWQGG